MLVALVKLVAAAVIVALPALLVARAKNVAACLPAGIVTTTLLLLAPVAVAENASAPELLVSVTGTELDAVDGKLTVN